MNISIAFFGRQMSEICPDVPVIVAFMQVYATWRRVNYLCHFGDMVTLILQQL